MNRYYTILILFLLTCFPVSLSAQKPGYQETAINEWKEFFNQFYGADFELVRNVTVKKERDKHFLYLPGNSFFFSFKTCESQQKVTFPDYDEDPVNP